MSVFQAEPTGCMKPKVGLTKSRSLDWKSKSAVRCPLWPPISLSTYSGGKAIVMPLVIAKDRGATCQSVTQL